MDVLRERVTRRIEEIEAGESIRKDFPKQTRKRPIIPDSEDENADLEMVEQTTGRTKPSRLNGRIEIDEELVSDKSKRQSTKKHPKKQGLLCTQMPKVVASRKQARQRSSDNEHFIPLREAYRGKTLKDGDSELAEGSLVPRLMLEVKHDQGVQVHHDNIPISGLGTMFTNVGKITVNL